MNKELARALTAAQSSDVVREMLERTATDPDFEGSKLSSLLAIHLLVFAGTGQALLDAPVRDAWIGLNPMQKWQVRRLAMRGRALGWTGENDQTRQKPGLHPYVGLIMAARINPRFVVTVGKRGSTRGIRVFAMDNGHDSTDCYIMEEPDFSAEDRHKSATPLDWRYRYWLLARPFLATYLANYSAVTDEEGSDFAEEPRVMSLYRPPVTDKNMVTSLDVHGAGSTAKVLRNGPDAPESGQPAEMTVEELAAVVSELLAR